MFVVGVKCMLVLGGVKFGGVWGCNSQFPVRIHHSTPLPPCLPAPPIELFPMEEDDKDKDYVKPTLLHPSLPLVAHLP